jgi:hypothetical protein
VELITRAIPEICICNVVTRTAIAQVIEIRSSMRVIMICCQTVPIGDLADLKWRLGDLAHLWRAGGFRPVIFKIPRIVQGPGSCRRRFSKSPDRAGAPDRHSRSPDRRESAEKQKRRFPILGGDLG